MDAVVVELGRRGWHITKSSEQDLEAGAAPSAELILNMCQGADASERLCALERAGVTIVNRPESVLSCHRHALVRQLAGTSIPFPRTLIVPSWLSAEAAQTLAEFVGGQEAVWIKRGDVHAERPDDVAYVRPSEISDRIATFAQRGITRLAVQEHVAGPVLKFYGVADQSFFRFYGADAGPTAAPPAVDEEALRRVAFAAAARLGLQIFGGDVVLAAPDQPVLVDINDWPSFAPFRADAAVAIARYLHTHAQAGAAA
jgi:glutathione synthase/RimK-type ligase-like ATP-grasp enzyme